MSIRPILPFLASKGFVPSIIPGRTNLQTNFVVPKLGHLKATLVYYVQTLAAIKAWPMMYTDGQLNPAYAMLVGQESVDLVMTMRQLDAMGLDCRSLILGLVEKLTGAGEGETVVPDQQMIAMMLDEQLAKVGFTTQDLMEMSEDSGFDLNQFFNDLVVYLCEQPAVEEEPARLLKALDATETPASRYERQLRDWLEPVSTMLSRE